MDRTRAIGSGVALIAIVVGALYYFKIVNDRCVDFALILTGVALGAAWLGRIFVIDWDDVIEAVRQFAIKGWEWFKITTFVLGLCTYFYLGRYAIVAVELTLGLAQEEMNPRGK